jgi:tRNA threonylcarbamoyladenosine biosynthesis protein TsaB
MRGESYVVDADVNPDGAISTDGVVRLVQTADVARIAAEAAREPIGPGFGKDLRPHARGAARMIDEITASGPCDLNTWEPAYGRLAEAQVKWEAAHGRPLVLEA